MLSLIVGLVAGFIAGAVFMDRCYVKWLKRHDPDILIKMSWDIEHNRERLV